MKGKSKNPKVKIAVAAIVVVMAFSAFKCGSSDFDAGTKGIDVWDANTVFNNPKGETPKGAKVFAKIDVSSQTKNAIDAGFTHTFNLIKREYNNPPTLREHAAYHVDVYRKNKLCIEQGFIVTAYKMGGNGWLDQSEYDKDPNPGTLAICAAGKWGLKDGTWHYVSIVEGLAQVAAQYEAEHGALFDVDPQRYAATSAAHYHPILTQALENTVKKQAVCDADGCFIPVK